MTIFIPIWLLVVLYILFSYFVFWGLICLLYYFAKDIAVEDDIETTRTMFLFSPITWIIVLLGFILIFGSRIIKSIAGRPILEVLFPNIKDN
jgi:amino acid permease